MLRCFSLPHSAAQTAQRWLTKNVAVLKILLTISVRPLISTSNQTIFTEFTGMVDLRTMAVDELSEVSFSIPLISIRNLFIVVYIAL